MNPPNETQPTEVPPDKIFIAIDGPLDKPNSRRRVRKLRPADMHDFVLCQDLDTGQIVTTFHDHLLPSKTHA